MHILVINTGSSSIKYQLLNMEKETVMATGIAERVGEPSGKISHKKWPGTDKAQEYGTEEPIKDHQTGMLRVLNLLADAHYGVVTDASDIHAVGHRVVHGGEAFKTPALIDDLVIQTIEATSHLAPLHNPANLIGIQVAKTLIPDAPQVAVFDTAFHQTIPGCAYHYALPYEYYKELGIRRYGFHGTSHRYVAAEAARLTGRPLNELNLITAHLGSGASICAIEHGQSIDTSMGLTPTGGVIMGTRCGNIDPGIIFYIAARKKMSFEEINRVLQHESGLKGICGSNDVRDIHERSNQGDARAQLALEMFVYRVKQYIGAYFANLGHVDALIFTAGIGEHDADIRRRCCEKMEGFGVVLDPAKNRDSANDCRMISTSDSKVQVFVIPTNEELQIAREAKALLASTASKHGSSPI